MAGFRLPAGRRLRESAWHLPHVPQRAEGGAGMTFAVEPLQPLALPLHGVRLIEASAGTGKTWTIAALYVRAVLGHGLPKPLLPPQILVVTFTEAATQEL